MGRSDLLAKVRQAGPGAPNRPPEGAGPGQWIQDSKGVWVWQPAEDPEAFAPGQASEEILGTY